MRKTNKKEVIIELIEMTIFGMACMVLFGLVQFI